MVDEQHIQYYFVILGGVPLPFSPGWHRLQHARKEHEHSLASLTAALRREADNDKAVAVGEYQTQSEEARQSAVAEAVAAQKELEIELRATIASLEEVSKVSVEDIVWS